jgi:hypothetical protein
MTTKRGTIDAALSVAEDVQAGRLDAADLEGEVEAACRDLFGTVAGPDDPLFQLQVEVSRGVLAAGGIPADELLEWVAVARNRERGPDTPVEPDQPAESI